MQDLTSYPADYHWRELHKYYFCRDKYVFVATKDVFCRGKSMLVFCRDKKIFGAAKHLSRKYLSLQT